VVIAAGDDRPALLHVIGKPVHGMAMVLKAIRKDGDWLDAVVITPQQKVWL
jgi:hypothetical protein